MKFTPAQIRELAQNTGFPAENLEKVLRLRELLIEFHRHTILTGKLVLKNKTNMARRFSVAWQRASRFDDARDSRFSSSVAIAPRRPVTSLTPDIAVLEEIVLLLGDGIRERLRRSVHAVGQHRNLVAQLPVFSFKSGDSFFQRNHFLTPAGNWQLLRAK